jgi:hypothetical protein
MADYTINGTKPTLGDLSPLGAADSSWSRLQPLVDPQKLRNTHLMGLTLISGMRDLNGRIQPITDDMLRDQIIEAVGLAETELGMDIFPTQHVEKLAFDANEFRALGYFRLRNRAISSIEDMTVNPANGVDIYRVPLDWIETAMLAVGQINIIPINIATVGGAFIPAAASQTGGAAFFLSILGQRNWIPAFWQVKYTTGFQDGKIPIMVNQLIGTVAAMEVLSQLAATYAKVSGHSTSIDGLGQSVSGPAGRLFELRMSELAAKRIFLVNKIKAAFGLKLFSDNA